MRLHDLLDESLVKVNLDSVDSDTCIVEMVDLMLRSGRLADRETALEAVRRREAGGTTGCGNGCAVPHGRHAAISGLHAALGISAKGIDFKAADGIPVRLVFMILASTGEPYLHLSALFEAARLMQSPGVCRRLIQAPSAAAVLDILDAEETENEGASLNKSAPPCGIRSAPIPRHSQNSLNSRSFSSQSELCAVRTLAGLV